MVALEQSRVHYLLIDRSKFDRSALMVYAPIDAFQRIFTDVEPPEKYRELFVQCQVRVSVAQQA